MPTVVPIDGNDDVDEIVRAEVKIYQGMLGALEPCSTKTPTISPSVQPTAKPTHDPTPVLSGSPTLQPTSGASTMGPTLQPTLPPTTMNPTARPADQPSKPPTPPTLEPTMTPTECSILVRRWCCLSLGIPHNCSLCIFMSCSDFWLRACIIELRGRGLRP